MADETLQGRQTNQPRDANLRVVSKAPMLDASDINDLQVDLSAAWDTCYTARADMNANLEAWDALYRLEVAPQEWPWENAANLVIPIIPAELDAMKSYIAAQVFVQRLVIVTAADGDPDTQRLAPKLEKFYNNELRRIRSDGMTFVDHLRDVLHLGLRDGTAPCDVFFTQRKVPKLVVTDEPKIVDDNVVLAEGGMPETERVMTRIEEDVREVSIRPRLLKEWYLSPDESTSVQGAPGLYSIEWMYEKELWEKVEEFKKSGGPGEWYADHVEQVLNRLNAGQSDVASDPLKAYDKDAGGQINIGQGQGALTSKFFRNRGPAKIIRAFSEQFDMDEDGVAEKCVFWFHAEYRLLLGWAPYEYVSGEWPSLTFTPFPDPCRVYGFSLCERLADIVAEANAGRNQRRNYIDLEIMPILLQRDGDTFMDKDRAYYPGAPWRVEDTKSDGGSVRWFAPPPLSADSFSDEGRLDVYVAKLTGQNAPAVGAQSSGRRTATETRQQQMAQSVRANDVAMEYRSFLRALVQFWHKLNKQYLGASSKALNSADEKGEITSIDPAILSRNFSIDIAGLADPVDAPSRRTEMMSAIPVMLQAFPWIFQDQVKSWAWAQQFVETFQWASTDLMVGTYEEAQQRQQAMQQQAQQQQALAAAQTGQPGGAGGAHPSPQPAGNGRPGGQQ